MLGKSVVAWETLALSLTIYLHSLHIGVGLFPWGGGERVLWVLVAHS